MGSWRNATGTLFTVRATNEMDGLEARSNAVEHNPTAFCNTDYDKKVVSKRYSIIVKKIKTLIKFKGAVIIRTIYTDDTVSSERLFKTSN